VVTPQEEAVPLEADKPIELPFSSSRPRVYSFDLKERQYTTIFVVCPDLPVTIKLLAGIDAPIDRYSVPAKPAQQTVEVVAETSGHYRLEIESTSSEPAGRSCTIQLAQSREASEPEVMLQQARTFAFRAVELMRAGKLDLALEPAQRALLLREKAVGSDQLLVADSNELLGKLSYLKADYTTAESLFLRALKMYEASSTPPARRVAELTRDLGTTYDAMQDFDKAVQFLQHAINILETMKATQDSLLADTLNNLANVYNDQGDYNKATAMYERGMAVEETMYGPNHPEVADFLVNLAGISIAQGDYLNAERLDQRALSMYEKAFGPEDYRLGFPLLSIGVAHFRVQEPEKAEPYFQQALIVFEKALGADHPLIGMVLNDLGETYRALGDFARAEMFDERSLSVREKKLGPNHSDVAQTLDSLGSLNRDRGDYDRAGAFYQRALAIREKALGPEHPDVVSTLTHMAALQMATRNFAAAEASLSRAIAISEDNTKLNLRAGSERQKLAYMKSLSQQLSQAITLNVTLSTDQAARDLAVTTVLQRKGRVQDALADTMKVLRQHLSPDSGRLLNDLDRVSSRLARLVLGGPQQTPIEEHAKRINALKEQQEHLEAEISLRSAEFRVSAQAVTLDAVRAALPEDCILLEFVDYSRFLAQGPTDQEKPGESRYIVYLIRRSGDVQWKDLGEAKILDDAIHAYRQALGDPTRNDVNQLARSLDEKILQPLRPSLAGATRLLISPDGQLSLIPFETLVDQQSQYAVQRYSITYLSAGRDLLRMQVSRTSKSGPLVIANPFFGEVITSRLAAADRSNLRNKRRSITTAADLSSVYFAPLEGTAQEARSIHSLFPEATVLTGVHASVAALKQAEAPSILHIATHGFFLEDQQISSRTSAKAGANGTLAAPTSLQLENPLVRSGLALAGANLHKTEEDSGILTALQASNLDLWGTKLVTLSACDTGVGEVKTGEGVYGLRRAFVLAGAETLVMSLWPVSDYVTREMMTSYYSGLKHGLGRGEALRQAQLAMLKRKGREHPFYWASFIQSGEWANLDGQR
jgi:CHAT domain-containing protein/lipopolysaccharide biosynthesis regulator YciM